MNSEITSSFLMGLEALSGSTALTPCCAMKVIIRVLVSFVNCYLNEYNMYGSDNGPWEDGIYVASGQDRHNSLM